MLSSLVKTAKKELGKYFNLNNPTATRLFINAYAPYVGAGVRVTCVDYEAGVIEVTMSLTRLNKNIVGTQFGGSLYSMTDPFFMTLLMQKLGADYVVWDKSASIDFVRAGTTDVFAKFCISQDEVDTIKELAKEGAAVFRDYEVDITDTQGKVVAKVQKTLYIRLRAFSKSAGFKSRF